MAHDEGVINLVRDLIDTCRDGEKAWKEAASLTKDLRHRDFFATIAAQRTRFAAELTAELRRFDQERERDEGHITSVFSRAWIEVREELGGGEAPLLEWLEQGEDYAREAYQQALRNPLPEETRRLIREQAESVAAVHDRIKAIRDERRAA